MPRPEAIFQLDYFKKSPEAFYQLAKSFLDLDNFDPTPTHYFCKLLANKGWVKKYMTQNIDNLEEKAGFNMEEVVQAHGANFGARCSKCGSEQDRHALEESIKSEKVLYCDNCKKFPVKPNIVFFGENLPKKFFTALNEI